MRLRSDYFKQYIRTVPDHPKKGIDFKDISPLVQNSAAFNQAVFEMTKLADRYNPEAIVGLETRGHWFASPIAYNLRLPFIPLRKGGKWPRVADRQPYELEYGDAVLELAQDHRIDNKRVVIVDDVLATGGTARAAAALIERAHGYLTGFVFLIDLMYLAEGNYVPLNGNDMDRLPQQFSSVTEYGRP